MCRTSGRFSTVQILLVLIVILILKKARMRMSRRMRMKIHRKPPTTNRKPATADTTAGG